MTIKKIIFVFLGLLIYEISKGQCESPCFTAVDFQLNGNCEITLDLTMLTPIDCDLSNLELAIYSDPSSIPLVINSIDDFPDKTIGGEGNWAYGIYELKEDNVYGLYCWGEFNTVSKSYFFGLPDAQYGTFQKVNYNRITGNIGSDKSFIPGQWSCWFGPFNPLFDESERFYETTRIRVDSSGFYTIYTIADKDELEGNSQFDLYSALYIDDFISNEPCSNLIQTNGQSYYPNPLGDLGISDSTPIGILNDSFGYLAPWLMYPYEINKINAYLEKDVDYELLITTLNANQTGSFKIFIYNHLVQNINFLQDPLNGLAIEVDSALEYYDFLPSDASLIGLDQIRIIDKAIYHTYRDSNLIYSVIGPESKDSIERFWLQLNQKLFDNVASKDTIIKIGLFPIQSTNKQKDLLQYEFGVYPFISNNCIDWELAIEDKASVFGDCGINWMDFENIYVHQSVERIFTLRNSNILDSIISDTINLVFRKPNFKDLSYPDYYNSYSYSEYLRIKKLENGHPDPEDSGRFYIKSLDQINGLTQSQSYYHIAVTFEDVAKVTTSDLGFKFRREWTVYDWCRPGLTTVYSQLFKIEEDTNEIDSDGDGVLDYVEFQDGTDFDDPCDFLLSSFTYGNTSNSWKNLDCDGDGDSNELEASNSSDFLDACSRVTGTPAPPQWATLPTNLFLTCEEALDFNSFVLEYRSPLVEPCIQTGEVTAVKSSNYGICGEDWILTWSFTDLHGQFIQHQQTISVGQPDCSAANNDLDIPEIAIQSQTIASKKNISSRGRVNSGSKVVFLAGEGIILQPGFEVAAGGEFRAKIQDCTSTNTIDISQQSIQISEQIGDRTVENIKIYPNPFIDIININMGGHGGQSQIDLLDINGRILKRMEADGEIKFTINLGSLNSGIYFVKVLNKNSIVIKKIIKI